VLFGTRVGGVTTGASTLAKDVLPSLRPGMLCLADRHLYGFTLWTQAHATGADLLWRINKNLHLPCEQRRPDGSYLSRVYASPKGQRHGPDGVVVRVMDYTLEGVPGAEPRDRLLTAMLEHDTAPATEMAALYHERGEIETALDEFKPHLRGARMVLQSKTPDLVTQKFSGLLLAHFVLRGLMHEAALKVDEDPDRLFSSTRCAWHVGRWRGARQFPPQDLHAFHEAVLTEILEERIVSSRSRHNPRGLKRKMSGYPLRPRTRGPTLRLPIANHIRIRK